MYNVLVYISLLYLCSRDELETSCLLSSVRHEMGGFIRLLHVHGPYVCVQSKGNDNIKRNQPRKVSAFLPRNFLAGAALGSR